MARPGRFKLELWANNHDSDTWVWFTDDDETTPQPLANYTALLQCWRQRTDSSPLLTLSSEGASPAIVLGSGSTGTITRTFLAATTAGLVVPAGWWSLIMTNTAPTPDEPRVLMESDFVIHPEGGG